LLVIALVVELVLVLVFLLDFVLVLVLVFVLDFVLVLVLVFLLDFVLALVLVQATRFGHDGLEIVPADQPGQESVDPARESRARCVPAPGRTRRRPWRCRWRPQLHNTRPGRSRKRASCPHR